MMNWRGVFGERERRNRGRREWQERLRGWFGVRDGGRKGGG